jgi:hypothetical protein
MFLSLAMLSTILSSSWFMIAISVRPKKKWQTFLSVPTSTPCRPRLSSFPSPTSVASESGLTLEPAQRAKPHLQPHWRPDIEAEPSIPQPAHVRTCSICCASYAHAAALFTHPLKSHSLHLLYPCKGCGSHKFIHRTGHDNRQTLDWQQLFRIFCPFGNDLRQYTSGGASKENIFILLDMPLKAPSPLRKGFTEGLNTICGDAGGETHHS